MRIPIVDTIIEKDGKLLMLKRAFDPKGKLDFPGGFVDENEDIEIAAIREVKEESGFDVKLVKKLGVFEYFYKGDKILHVFIGEVTGSTQTSSIEGTPVWIDPRTISAEDLAFPQIHVRVINEYFKLQGIECSISDFKKQGQE